ncbi:hypothetical protein MZM54_03540 [[Brevibacterium] frigoritolerans]|nr:hypothetical protein [Peribacillus frigoritolerans]
MEVSNGNTTLSELKEGKWYFIADDEQAQSNSYTGIKIEDDWIYIELKSGEFKEPYKLRFKYSQESLNGIFQQYFSKDYDHPLDKNTDDLNWVNSILKACLF